MAERVAEIPEEPLHEDALIAASNELMILLPKGSYNLHADAATREEIVEQVVVAALDALPSGWLLARALTREQLDVLLTTTIPPDESSSKLAAWQDSRAALRAALSVLEQEAGGER